MTKPTNASLFSPRLAATVAVLFALSHDARSNGTMADNEIRFAVEEKLDWDQGVLANDIETAVKDGIVTLTGEVENLIMKDRTAAVAKTRRGVRGVINRLTVRPASIPDETIAAAVNASLRADPLGEAYPVSASVEDGEVTLTGQVNSRAQQRIFVKSASSVAGVRRITDDTQLVIAPRDRAEIAAQIESRLENDVWLSGSHLTVAVDDSKEAAISGIVKSAALRDRAEEIAWKAGVKTVDSSGVGVEPWLRDPEQRPLPGADRTDGEIAAAIRLAWEMDPRVLSHQPELFVSDGIVTLSGEVSTLASLVAAFQDTRNTVGVRSVVNLLRVKPMDPVEDSKLENSLAFSLRNHATLGRYDIDAKVSNGRASLTGLVDNPYEKSEATRLALHIPGIREIRNQLIAEETEARVSDFPWDNVDSIPLIPFTDFGNTAIDDRIVAAAIQNEFEWNWQIDPEAVSVRVQNGVAHLEGKVPDLGALSAATSIALDAGAESVINALAVRNKARLKGETALN